MLAVRDIEKSFCDTHAVRGVSFDVPKGEIFGIVGPDGAGKSTLLRIIASTLEPDSGTISIGGVSLASAMFKAREKIAYMPQRFGLYEDLTVEENIRFFGSLFNYFFRGLFFWLVLAELFSVANCLLLVSCRCLDPCRQLDASTGQQFDDTRGWLCTIIKILLSGLYLNINFLGMRVVAANIGDNTTT